MDLEGLSIESISAMKQAQVQNQYSVGVIKGINKQSEAVAAIIVDAIEACPKPRADGKGQRVNVVA